MEYQYFKTIKSPLWFHNRGLMQTATGYGKKLKTEYMIMDGNRKRRVYYACFSNAGVYYFIKNGEEINLDFDAERQEFYTK